MPDASFYTDCPEPPRRLVTDCVPLKKPDYNPAWEARRMNKMRERFPASADQQPLSTMNLVAPVQPTIYISPFIDKPF